MFSRLKNFICRHRRKFIVTGVVLGGTIFAINYVQRKFLEWQEKEAREFFRKAKKEQHFKTTERTCNQTIFSLSKTLKESIFQSLNSDVILQKIREGESSRVPLWEELKVVVFAQICALIYSGMMLVTLLRIQLNIIGGYMIREKDISELTNASQEKYLSLCQHFLEVAVKDICALMLKHSELILKNVSLKHKMTLKDIEHVFWRLESSLNQDPLNPIKNLSLYLIPPENEKFIGDDEAQFFKNIVSETVDLLQHEEVLSVCESSIKRAFSNTVDKIAEYYIPADFENGKVSKNGCTSEILYNGKIVNMTDVTVHLAKLVPILHGLYRGSAHNGSPDPWIEQFIVMDQMNNLGLDIYETYSFEESI
ncbi:peroxisomal biogenesis factor 3 [Halyomorpha halys]|uniref:peroxisomal biogenesis factor 3 n=1 Tax=Halyomorpha halys TaxID=286706 RepID=UPI0006D5283B|nr:peroxisomal biogenesis factor 3 [Halyomorpha halys]